MPMRTYRVGRTLIFLGGIMSKNSGFAFVKLCCHTAASLRAASLQQQAQSFAVHVANAAQVGFLARPTTACSRRGSRGLRTRASAAAAGTSSHFAGRGGNSRSSFAAFAQARQAYALTRSRALLAAALLLSSPPSAAAVGAAGGAARPAGGWGGRRRGVSSTPSMTASAIEHGVPVERRGGGRDDGGDDAVAAAIAKSPVIFVLGGPGSGKGTQCERLAKEFGYVHLSAGELLREERASGSSDGQLIDEYIREGRIVPVAISLGLLRKAMEASGPHSRFLIDGFPRNKDNVEGWEAIMGDVADVRAVLFLYCPEDVLEQRLLSRGKSSGRTDDNAETAKRRFRTYVETTIPVVEKYEREGLVVRVNGNQAVESVFSQVVLGLRPVQEVEVLGANRLAIEAVCAGNFAAYAEFCASEMTEQLGGGLAIAASDGTPATQTPMVLRPQVRVLSRGGSAVTSCERPRGPGLAGGGSDSCTLVQETRVWEVQGGRWRCVHCHTSLR